MAFNPSPHVADCREIARKWGVQQVVILGVNVNSGRYEVTSYGQTKQLCDDAARIAERIYAMLQYKPKDFDAYELAGLKELYRITPDDPFAKPTMLQHIEELERKVKENES